MIGLLKSLKKLKRISRLALSSSWKPQGITTKSSPASLLLMAGMLQLSTPSNLILSKMREGVKVKNDKIDALWIALTFRLTNSAIAQPSSETLDCLKNLCRQYYNLSDELTSYKYRLTSVVDQIMLNFKEIFPDICSKTSLAILENYLTPNDTLSADSEKLISIIQQTSKKATNWLKKNMIYLSQKLKNLSLFLSPIWQMLLCLKSTLTWS